MSSDKYKRKTYCISNKFAFLQKQFASKGWRDVKEEVEDAIDNQEDFHFDFSLYYFDSEKRSKISSNQILSEFHGMIVTSKNGMHNVLKNAKKNYLIDNDWFFPKCFDLQDK